MDTDVEMCVICQEIYEIAPDPVTKLRCTHYYHQECIDAWMGWCMQNNRTPNCPACRAEIVVEQSFDSLDHLKAASRAAREDAERRIAESMVGADAHLQVPITDDSHSFMEVQEVSDGGEGSQGGRSSYSDLWPNDPMGTYVIWNSADSNNPLEMVRRVRSTPGSRTRTRHLRAVRRRRSTHHADSHQATPQGRPQL